MNNNDVNPNNTSNPVVSSSTANIPVVDPNTTSVPVVDPNMNTATIPTVDPNTASLPVVNPLEVKVTNEVEENPTPVVSTAIGQVVSKGLTGAVKLSRHLLSNYQKESKLVYFAHG